ncbi:unnamed protein product, partial [Didymodactylos carnosus]
KKKEKMITTNNNNGENNNSIKRVLSSSTPPSSPPLLKEKEKKHVHYPISPEENQQIFMYEKQQKKNKISLIKNKQQEEEQDHLLITSPKTDTIIYVGEEIANGLNHDKNLTGNTVENFINAYRQLIEDKNQLSNGHAIKINDDDGRRRCGTCCCLSRVIRRQLSKSCSPIQEFVQVQSSWSWVILIAGFLTYSIGEALTSVFPILFVALQAEFTNEGSSRLAWVQSMMNSVPCLIGPIASILTTRLGYRKTTMLGGFITSMSLLASSFARKLEILYLTMGFCYSFGNSLVLVATVVAVTEHFEYKPSFASGVTISGGAFGQCVFAIVLQKLINRYKWYGALMLFSGIVFLIVAFGALFREVEYDEDEEEEEEEEIDEETENQGEGGKNENGGGNTELETLEKNESTKGKKDDNIDETTTDFNRTDDDATDMVFYDQLGKQDLYDQYSKSELCLPTAVRQHFEDEYLYRKATRDGYQLSHEDRAASINQIDLQEQQSVPIEHSSSCKDIVFPEPIAETLAPLSLIKPTNSKSNNSATKKRSNVNPSSKFVRRTQRSSSTNNDPGVTTVLHYPFHHQHHHPQRHRHSSVCHHPAHHHSHHTSALQCNYGANISQLRLCSKNIYNYESLLNICKLQSLHFRIDRSLSCPNLFSSKQLIPFPVVGDEDEDEKKTRNPFKIIYRELCQLVKVLRILPFLLLCFSVTIITIFYDATWTFLIDYMKKNHLSDDTGSHLILAVGIISIFGEIGYGYMGDSKRIHPLYLYATSLTVSGLCHSLIPFAIKSSSKLLPLMLFIGFLQSAQEVLMPILCIKFAGATNFPSAYGMLLLCQGISSLLGPPLLGAIADRMRSYDLTYYAISLGTVVASSFLFTMPLVQKFYKYIRVKKKTNSTITSGGSGNASGIASASDGNGITRATSSSFVNHNNNN